MMIFNIRLALFLLVIIGAVSAAIYLFIRHELRVRRRIKEQKKKERERKIPEKRKGAKFTGVVPGYILDKWNEEAKSNKITRTGFMSSDE